MKTANEATLPERSESLEEITLGLAAYQDARQLAGTTAGAGSALLLYRSAIRLFAFAWMRRDRRTSCPDALWSQVVVFARGLPGWPEDARGHECIERAVVSDEAETYLANLSNAERERALAEMHALAEALGTPLVQELVLRQRGRWPRRARIALALSSAACLVLWGVLRLTARPNLALHRPVAVSDQDPPNAVDPAQLVDGDRMNLGFHTTRHAGAWVSIDLGTAKPIAHVDVYNRADCCQERVGPLSLALSSDGTHYTTVTRHTGLFVEWSAHLPAGTQARFVRLVHEADDYFHLSEVEIY
jgi:hypothetical protein